jgi:ribosome-binding factor A
VRAEPPLPAGRLFPPAAILLLSDINPITFSPMKHRLERVNELIRRELGDLVTRECSFESKLVTIQQVDVTPDLKHAHVFVSMIGTDAETHRDLSLLRGARTQLQQLLAKRVVLKYTPHLHFKLDESIERGTRILNILDQLEHGAPEDE